MDGNGNEKETCESDEASVHSFTIISHTLILSNSTPANVEQSQTVAAIPDNKSL